jgi:threonine/homoserine/homoserine lactone efflux protein
MLLRAFGEMLPAAMGVALSPFPIIAVVLVLGAVDAVRTGVAFATGWVLGIGALTTVIMLLIASADTAGSTQSTVIAWVRVAAGAAMILVAAKKWRTRPRKGDDPVMPPWMARLDGITPARAFRLGAALGGANPKNVALITSAVASITELGLHGGTKVAAGAILVALSSCTVLGAVLARAVAGDKAVASLESVKQFMLDNNNVIMMVVLLLLGATVLGNGLEALSW